MLYRVGTCCLWTTPKTRGNYPALINKHFSLLADVVAGAISSSSHGEEATLKCLRSEQSKSYGCLRIANELVHLNQILIKFELGTGQIWGTRWVSIGPSVLHAAGQLVPSSATAPCSPRQSRAYHCHPPEDQSGKTGCSHPQTPAREHWTMSTVRRLRFE